MYFEWYTLDALNFYCQVQFQLEVLPCTERGKNNEDQACSGDLLRLDFYSKTYFYTSKLNICATLRLPTA